MNRVRTVAALLMLVCSAILPVVAAAATFIVTSAVDGADETPGDGVCASTGHHLCTLRAAIQEANALGGADTIRLKPGLYVLTIAGRAENAGAAGDLDITGDLTISGAGASRTFVNGGKVDRVFHVLGPIAVTMTDLTVQNGLAGDDGFGNANSARGGGILNDAAGTLTLRGITVSNNAASGPGSAGGGIHNSGTLTITRSALSGSSVLNNAALGGGVAGGGIFNAAGALRVRATAVLDNMAAGTGDGYGGGIMNYATSEIRQSTVSNNTVSVQGEYGEGGGLNNNGTMTISRSTISGNTARGGRAGDGGGIANGGGLTITASVVSGNAARGPFASGGGIATFVGDVAINGTTLSNNAASAVSGNPGRGGGIFVGYSTAVSFQGANKILRNFASDAGGGICYANAGGGVVSAETTVARNIPDNTYAPP